MTEQDKRTERAEALLNHTEAESTLNHLRAKADRLGETIQSFGCGLIEAASPEESENKFADILNLEHDPKVKEAFKLENQINLVRDIYQAEHKLRKAIERKESLGL